MKLLAHGIASGRQRSTESIHLFILSPAQARSQWVSNEGAFLPRSIRLRKSTETSSASANCFWVRPTLPQSPSEFLPERSHLEKVSKQQCPVVSLWWAKLRPRRPHRRRLRKTQLGFPPRGIPVGLPDSLESCKREFGEHCMQLQLVRPDEGHGYNIVVAQESSLAGAAATVIALDSKGLFVASLVRAGHCSGRGSVQRVGQETAALRNH